MSILKGLIELLIEVSEIKDGEREEAKKKLLTKIEQKNIEKKVVKNENLGVIE